MNKYEKFWKWFRENEETYYYKIEEDMEYLVPLLQEKLVEINENMTFEISEVLGDSTRDFIISADGIFSAFNDVLELYSFRLDLSKWTICSFRAREEVISHSVELDGLKLSYEDISYEYDLENSKINIQVYIKGYDNLDNRYIHAYFLLLDSLIGEFDAVTMIENTDVFPWDSEQISKEFYSLKKVIDDLKRSDS